MKMPHLFIATWLLTTCQVLWAQGFQRNDHDYSMIGSRGMTHYTVDKSKIMVALTDTAGQDAQDRMLGYANALINQANTSKKLNIVKGGMVIQLPQALDSAGYFSALDSLQQMGTVKYAAPVLLYRNIEQLMYDLFYVKVKSPGDVALLNAYADTLHFTVESSPLHNVYYCHVTKNSGGNAFQIAKYLQRLDIFKYAEPDFIATGKLEINDSLYPQQWSLKNTGPSQYPGWTGSVAGDDIHIDSAFISAGGSPNVTVAVLDVFGDTLNSFTHPDFSFADRYDATQTNFENDFPQNQQHAHGLACGSLIGATTNNGIGIAGIADKCRVVAVKIGLINDPALNSWTTSGEWVANGITWAYKNADIINNSYYIFLSSYTLTDEAIQDAVDSGRNGKGCLFFASTGDVDTDVIAYPSSNPNAIAVGGTTFCNTRKTQSTPDCTDDTYYGSCYGTGIGVAAPFNDIWAADIVGDLGFSDGEYFLFWGTSASSPITAALAALMLSADTCLTGAEVRNIIESTCDKVGGYNYMTDTINHPNGTWSDELGYGLINANNALAKVPAHTCNTIATGVPAPPDAANPAGVYPNPTHSLIYLNTDLHGDVFTVTVMDVLGRKLLQNRIMNNTSSLDLSALEAGMYMVDIVNPAGEHSVQRLVKE